MACKNITITYICSFCKLYDKTATNKRFTVLRNKTISQFAVKFVE